MRAHSMDLRVRVLADCDAGLSSCDVAARYRVSRAWVDRLRQRRREIGEIEPQRPRRFKAQAVGGAHGGVADALATHPDMTLAELRHALGV